MLCNASAAARPARWLISHSNPVDLPRAETTTCLVQTSFHPNIACCHLPLPITSVLLLTDSTLPKLYYIYPATHRFCVELNPFKLLILQACTCCSA